MANIGSLGIGSGLDLNGLLDKIAAAEQAPLNAIKARSATYNAKLSAYGTVKSLLGGLQAAAAKLADPAFMGSFRGTSSAPTVLDASVDATAAAGTYNVNVTQLAQSQSLVSSGVANTLSDIGTAAATLTIDFGSISGSLDATTGTYGPGASFQPDAGRTPISISLASGTTSLADVRDAINKAAGGAVAASIVNDGVSNRLVLASTVTGQRSSMRVAVGGGNTELQALLGNDPAGTQALRQTVAAQDAGLTVNGITVTGPTNTVAGAIQGVTLKLAASGTSVVQVSRDTGAVQAGINDFVSAYNKLTGKLQELDSYSPGSQTGGPLLGDSAVRTVEARLRATLFEAQPVQAGDPARLSDVGVAVQKDGTLAVTASRLSAALQGNPEGLARMFAGTATTQGIADRFAAVVGQFTDDDNGLLKAAVDGTTKSLARLNVDYQHAQERIDAKVAAYRAQFRQLDSVMSGLTATSNYLTQQFNNITNKK